MTFAPKVPYLTFCDNLRQFLINRKWIEQEEKKRKWENVESESFSISSPFPHSLSPFPLHFLIFSPLSCSQAATICAILICIFSIFRIFCMFYLLYIFAFSWYSTIKAVWIAPNTKIAKTSRTKVSRCTFLILNWLT